MLISTLDLFSYIKLKILLDRVDTLDYLRKNLQRDLLTDSLSPSKKYNYLSNLYFQ